MCMETEDFDGTLFGRVRGGPVVVDLFAGGGGASLGLSWAFGVSPVVAINHCRNAIEMHARNHPETQHFLESVFDVAPLQAARGRGVDLLWLSPDCTHFSKAKGGKPRSQQIRGLAWIGVDWARDVRPKVIALENVEEFQGWGPLYPEDHPVEELRNKPIKERAGETFREFVAALEAQGYTVSWRVLSAADYGTPTTRKRLFLVARCDGRAYEWPEPTHGPGRALPWHTAAECIDWTIPMLSVLATREEARAWAREVGAAGVPQRPLAYATRRRIAEGIKRFVLGKKRPFLVNLLHGGRLDDVDAPMPTVTAAHRGERAAIAPIIAPVKTWGGGGNGAGSVEVPMRTVTAGKRGEFAVAAASLMANNTNNAPQDIDDPLGTVTTGGRHIVTTAHLLTLSHGGRSRSIETPINTITAGPKGGDQWLLATTMIDTRNGEREGQAPRARDVDRPMGTVTAKGSQGGVVAAYLAQHNGTTEGKFVLGRSLDRPMQTSVARINRGPVAVFLDKHYGSASAGQSAADPMATITGGGGHVAPVGALLGEVSRHAGEESWRPRARAVATFLRELGAVEDDGADVVTLWIDDVQYVIVDIAMRMLVPRELARANGFPDSYVLVGTKEQQTARIGNSVCPQLSEAIARAAFPELSVARAA